MSVNLPLVLLGIVLADPMLDHWSVQKTGADSKLRGVHALDSRTVWASGMKGTFLVTKDGGETWTKGTVPGAEGLDFRDVHATTARSATLLASGPGSLSQVFQTDDGGKSWTRRYTNTYPSGFLDGFAFWNGSSGLILGDPVDGLFRTFLTEDGGKTWHLSWGQLPSQLAQGASSRDPRSGSGMPIALTGEGAFAASGTCLAVQGEANAWFGTGGAKVSRVFRTTDSGRSWEAHETPIPAGNPSSGIFSLAFRDKLHGVAVGGDYKVPDAPGLSAARTTDGGLIWKAVTNGPRGYRSAVAYVPKAATPTLIAVGPTGSVISTDDGLTWKPLGDEGFHALSIAGSADAIWAVGDDGKVARLVGTSR